MSKRKSTLDIETLGIPETAGYGIIIPNFAFVIIPESPITDHLEYLYVQCPIQPQIDEGLSMSASTMQFWFDFCNRKFPGSKDEMMKSFDLDTVQIHSNNKNVNSDSQYLPNVIRQFVYGTSYGDDTEVPHEVYGNGCNFDCSILQENQRVMYADGKLWAYNAPQNARTLKERLNAEQRKEMNDLVKSTLSAFVSNMGDKLGVLELHHPLYDAAREALQISYCLNVLDQNKD